MLVKTVTVKNFRCAKDGVLNCEKLTALVGANGSGKSTFLRALQLFYDTNPRIDRETGITKTKVNRLRFQ